jgi:hydroxymethylglutaryl-CoA reductase (NADPH)
MDPTKHRQGDHDAIVQEIVEGKRRLHELSEDLPASKAAEIRRRAVAQLRQVELEHLARYSLDPTRVSRRHCENFIGATQIPVGIVGPVKIRGERVREEEDLYVPMATTEGALIASVNRGCQALREAGGAVVRVEDVGMTRAPVFRTSGIAETRRFLEWVREHEDEIRKTAEATSSHLRLADIRPQTFGSSIYLRFRFATGDAMGMNMATIACDRVVRDLIEPATKVPCVALSGNYCVDKKPSAVNFLEGRGKKIYAEADLSGEVLQRCLKSSAQSLVEVQYRKNLLGSIAAGSMGFNAHFANVLAALFIATGQDVAQVVEGAMGVTCIEARGTDGVYASVYLPDVPLGVVGGGTALGPQKEALALLGAAPDAQHPGAGAVRLAEIVGATVLAGELSLLAAFTSGDLAGAHERLGRGAVPEPT